MSSHLTQMPVITSCWPLILYPPEDRPEQVVLVCLCVVVYHLLGRIPRAFPRSFTEGELAVCLQIVFIPLYPIVVIACQVSLQWRSYKNEISSYVKFLVIIIIIRNIWCEC